MRAKQSFCIFTTFESRFGISKVELTSTPNQTVFTTDLSKAMVLVLFILCVTFPAGILYKSTADRYRPVSYPDGPITARYRFM